MSDEKVFKEFYEIVGAAERGWALAFALGIETAHHMQFKVARSLGAEGYRPGPGGMLKSLLFPLKKLTPLDIPKTIKEPWALYKAAVPPAGFRKVAFEDGRVECEPVRNTKIGKEMAAKLATPPKIPNWRTFADEFGWNGRSPMGAGSGSRTGFCIFYAGVTHINNPREWFFLQLPRQLKDGWKKPPGLKLVRESEVLRAIEDHNEIARKKRDKKKKAV